MTAMKSMLHGLSRGLIGKWQGGSFKVGFMSGLSSAFDVGTKGYGGFTGRTVIMAVVGGTASALGGGKFSNGAISGAFVHMFNAEYDTLGKAFKGLWTKITDGTIVNAATKGYQGFCRDAVPALQGGLEGYRQVRDNSPWYAQVMLKGGMTAVEMGLTGWMTFAEYPIAHIWYNTTSGVYMDTVPYFNQFALPANIISGESGMNTTWFE